MTIFTSNWRLKLAAVFIASTTWGVVAYAGNPVETRSIDKVPIQLGTPPNNWVMVSQLPAISVTISGLHQNVVSYQSSNLHASVDLTSARLGPNVVHVAVDNADTHVAISQVTPASVEVILDEKDVVTKKVDVRFKNSPNSCCVAQNSKATLNPDSVRLSGPKSVVAKAVPFVEVDLSEARTDVQQNPDVRLDATDRKAVPLVTIEPKQVQVVVPVAPAKKRGQAAIRAPFVGQVAAGYEITDIKFTPDVLTVEGDPTLIAGITSLDTPQVNLSGATSDINQTLTVRPPAGLTIIGSAQVTIHVAISRNPAVQPSPNPSPSPSPSP